MRSATSTILAIYLLTLAFLPCADNAQVCVAEASGQPVEITNLAGGIHHHSSEESDHCSPLCICSCCGTFVVLGLKPAPPVQRIAAIEEEPLLPVNRIADSYLSSVFRPPIPA
ncbi:MAG: hypothetical protein H6560_11125 [Lewinellaceae bacterium]|nr:hypothetical protein [Lewinellaceae bacterium]